MSDGATGGAVPGATAAALLAACEAVSDELEDGTDAVVALAVLHGAIAELLTLRAALAEAESRWAAVAAHHPYPVDVFSDLTAAEEAEILAAIRGTSVRHATDRVYAAWGRRVLAAATAGGRGP